MGTWTLNHDGEITNFTGTEEEYYEFLTNLREDSNIPEECVSEFIPNK